jgi:hypothetical protein
MTNKTILPVENNPDDELLILEAQFANVVRPA